MTAGRIVVVGALHVDRRYEVGILPGPGETVLARSMTVAAGGKGANQAIASAAAGARTVMIGTVGDDTGADLVLSALARRGVDTARVLRLDARETGGAVVLIDVAAENSIVIVPGANAERGPDEIGAALHDLVATDVLVLQNELPGVLTRAAANRARSVGARVVWNAAPAPTRTEDLMEHADVVVCNEHECLRLAQLLDLPAGSTEASALAIADRLDAAVICTLGAEGAVVASAARLSRVPSPRVDAVDTTGAGDTFVGYLAAALLVDRGLLAAATTASFAGALAVTRSGAADAIPDAAEVHDLADLHDTIGSAR